jgi:hypothetical protein
MMYSVPELHDPIMQGDLIQECPILFWDEFSTVAASESKSSTVTVVILTQSCDLAQAKSNRVVVATVHNAAKLVELGIVTPKMIREQIRLHRVYGWYFLPAGSGVEESIVDLRDLHTLPRKLLEKQIALGKRLARISTPYREHLAQHFATTYSRIGLPEPYPTQT